jgi:glucose/arabinose dehydrogenase
MSYHYQHASACRCFYFAWCLLSGAGLLSLSAQQPTPGDDDELPQVPAGFQISLVAQEPLVRNPCSMAFDSRGRLFVGMGPQYRHPRPETSPDSVVLLLDNDNDGRFDARTTFATGFNCIQGLAWRGSDLWVANAPARSDGRPRRRWGRPGG